MSVNDKEMVLLAVIFVIIVLRLYINSLKPQGNKVTSPADGCPGNGEDKLHKWAYDLTEGGYVCTVCNKKPGTFDE